MFFRVQLYFGKNSFDSLVYFWKAFNSEISAGGFWLACLVVGFPIFHGVVIVYYLVWLVHFKRLACPIYLLKLLKKYLYTWPFTSKLKPLPVFQMTDQTFINITTAGFRHLSYALNIFCLYLKLFINVFHYWFKACPLQHLLLLIANENSFNSHNF